MDFTSIIIFTVVAGLVLGIGVLIIQSIAKSHLENEMKDKLEALDDFTASQSFISENGINGLAIDEERKKIWLYRNLKGVESDVMNYRDILASEIFEDGNTVIKTSRTSQIGGALLGGLALGGVGAIIGGISAKNISSDKVTTIELRLTVDSTKSPVHDINFMNIECDRNGIIYTAQMQQARHWHGLIDVLIRRADEEDRSEAELEFSEERQVENSNSIADELKKLVDLKNQGVLTEEEFTAQKLKLLK